MSLPDSNLAEPFAAEPLAEPEPARAVVVQKPRANVYTTMLAISLTAIVIGCICLAAELNAYGWNFSARP
jgi:hypothetical protein